MHITGHCFSTAPVYLASAPLQSLSNNSNPPSHEENSPPTSTSSLQRSQSIVGVEGYAIHQYSTELGWPCALHAEGLSFTTLFALLMWDVIFMSGIPDVFRTKFQVSEYFSSDCGHLVYRYSCVEWTTWLAQFMFLRKQEETHQWETSQHWAISWWGKYLHMNV